MENETTVQNDESRKGQFLPDIALGLQSELRRICTRFFISGFPQFDCLSQDDRDNRDMPIARFLRFLILLSVSL